MHFLQSPVAANPLRANKFITVSSCCADGNVATGRIFHTGQAKGDNPHIKEYSDRPGWELGVRERTAPLKNIYVEKSQKDPSDGTDKEKMIWL